MLVDPNKQYLLSKLHGVYRIADGEITFIDASLHFITETTPTRHHFYNDAPANVL